MTEPKEGSLAKSSKEQVIVEEGGVDIKIDSSLTGPDAKPSAVVTGGGQIQSAGDQNEPEVRGTRSGTDSVYEDPGEVSSPNARVTNPGFANKTGMAKSAQEEDPKLATNLRNPTSRATPDANLEARTNNPEAKKAGVATAENPPGAPAKGHGDGQ